MQENRPNIVFIISDDQGAWALNCANNSDIHTPNLNELFEHGVLFENFFCCSPVCSPARASIFTGKMPSAHGVHDWIAKGNLTTNKYKNSDGTKFFNANDVGVEYLQNEQIFVEFLQKSGYKCALSGKWHLGNNDIPKKGFEKWYTIATGGCEDYYNAHVYDGNSFSKSPKYITDCITDKAIDYINEYAAQSAPFYLSVHYTAPHSPWAKQCHPKEMLDIYNDCKFSATPNLPVHINQIYSAPIGDTQQKRRENLQGYYGAISAMDKGIGEIIAKLKSTKTYDNTVIIFTSDNGMNMGHHGIWGKGNGTYPPNLYDTSVKVPFIVSSPLFNLNSVINKNLHSHYDVFATVLEIAKCTETQMPCIGQSFYGELINENVENKKNAVYVFDEYGAVRMIRTHSEKYIKNYTTGEEQYYNLLCDKNEDENCINDEKYSENIAKLKQKMNNWFLQNETEQNSGKQYDVRGRGQHDLCHKSNAFSDVISFYHESRHKDNFNANDEFK